MEEGASNLCTQLSTLQDPAASSNITYSGKSHPGTSALNTSTSGFYIGDPSTDSTASVLQTNTAAKHDNRIYEKNNLNSPATRDASEKHDSSFFLPGLVTQSSLTDNYQTGSHNSSAQTREQSGINKSEENFNVKEYQMIISASSLLSSLCTTHVSTFPQPAVAGYKANQNNNNNNIVKSESRQGPQADYKQQSAKSSSFSHPYTVLNRPQTAANSASAAIKSSSGDGRKTYTDRPVVTITHTSFPSAHDLNVSIQTSPLSHTKKEKPTGHNFRTVNVPSNIKQLHKPSINSSVASTTMTPFIHYTTTPSTSGNLPVSSKQRPNFAWSNSSEKLVTVQTKPVSTKKPRVRSSRKKEAAEKLPVTFDDDDDDNDFIPVGMCQLPLPRKPDASNANLFSPESTLGNEYNLLSQGLGSTYPPSPSQEFSLQEKVVLKHQEPSQVLLLEQMQQPNMKLKDSDLQQFGKLAERMRTQHTNPIHQLQFEQKHETVLPFVGGDRTKTQGFLKNQGLIIHHQQPHEAYTQSVNQRSNTLESVQQNQPNVDNSMQFSQQFPKEHVKSAVQEHYKEPGYRQPEKSKHNLLQPDPQHSTQYLADNVIPRPETSHQHNPPKLAEQLLQQPRVEQILQQNNDQTSKLELGLSKQDQTTAFRSVTPTSVHVHYNPSLNQQHPEIAKMLNSPVSPRQPASPRQSISPRRTVSPHPSSISPSQFVSPYPRQVTSPRQPSKPVASVSTSNPHPPLSKPTTSPQTKQSHSPHQRAVSWQSQSTSQPSPALNSNIFGQAKSFSGQLPVSKAAAEQMNQAINTLVPIGHPVTVNLESVQLPLESTDVPHTKSGFSSSMEQNKLFSLASTHHDVYQMQQVSSDLSFDDDEPIPYSFPSSQPSQIFSPGQVIHHRPPDRKQTSVKAKQRPGSGMSAQLPSPSVLSSTVPVPSVQNASTIWQPLQHVEPKPDLNVQSSTQDSNAQPSKDVGRISSQSQDAHRQNVVYPKGPALSGAMSSSSEIHQWQGSSELSHGHVSGKPTIEMQLYPTPSSISQSSASLPDSTPAIHGGIDRDTPASSVQASDSNISKAQQMVESTKETKSQDSQGKGSGVEDFHLSTPQQRSEAPRRDDGLKVLSKIASECYVKTVAEENKSVLDQNKFLPSEETISPNEENSKEGQTEKKDSASSLPSTTEYRLTRKKLNESIDKSENQDGDTIGKEADGKDQLSSSNDVPKREVRQRKPKKPFEQEDQPVRKNAKQNQKTTPTLSGQKKLPTPSKKGQIHRNLQSTLKIENEDENKLSQKEENVKNLTESDGVTKSNNVDLKTGMEKKKSEQQKSEIDVSTKALDMQEMSSRRLSQRLLVKEKETKKEDNEENARRSKRQSAKIDYKEGTESVEDSSSVKSARSSRRTSPSYSSSSVESKERMTTRSANRKDDEFADKSLNKKQNNETDQKSTVKKSKPIGPDDTSLNKKHAVEKIDDKLRVKRRKDDDQPAEAKKRKDFDAEITKLDTRGSSKELTVPSKRVTRTPVTTGGGSQNATSVAQVKAGLRRSLKSSSSELSNLNNSATTPRRMTTRQLVSEKETPNSSSEATVTRTAPAEGRRGIKKKTEEDSVLTEVDSKSVPGADKKQKETESTTEALGNEKNTSRFAEETPKRKVVKAKSRKLKSGYKRKRWRKFRGNKNIAVKLKTDRVAKTDKTDPGSDENDEKQNDNKNTSAEEVVEELKISDEKISVDVTENKKTELHKTGEAVAMDTDLSVIKSCGDIEENTQHKSVIKATTSLDANVAPGPNDTDLSISVVNQTKDFGQTQFQLESASNRQKMVIYKLVPVCGEDVSELEDTLIPISGYFVPGGNNDRILLPQNFMSGSSKASTTALGWGTTSSGNESSEPRISSTVTSADKVSKLPPNAANLDHKLTSYSPLRTTTSSGVSSVAPSTTWPPSAQTSSATWPLQLPPPVPTPPPSVGEPAVLSSKKTWPVSQPQASPSTYRPSPSWNTTPPSLLSSSPLSSSSSTWNMSSTSSLPLSHQNSLTWTAPPTSQETSWRSSTSHQAVESWSKEYFPSSNSTPVLPQASSQGLSVNQNYSLDSGTPNTQTPTYQPQDQTGSGAFYGNGVPQDSDFTDSRQENLIQGFLRQVTSNAGGFSQELSGFNLGQQDFAYLENKLRQELSPNTLFSAVAAYDDSSEDGPEACQDSSLQDSINLVHTVNLDMEEGNIDSSANLDLSGIAGHTPRPISIPKSLDSHAKTPHRMGMHAASDIESPALLDSSACLDSTPQMDNTPQLESPLTKDDKVKKDDKKVMKERKHQYDIITENEVRRYKCKACGKMFGNATIYRHLRTHDPDYKVTCHLCEKKYTQKTSLLLHIKKCHSDQLPEPVPSHTKDPEVDDAEKDQDKSSPSKRQRRASSSANPLAASLDESEILKQQETHRQVEELRRLKAEKKLHGKATGAMADDVTVVGSEVIVNEENEQDNPAVLEQNSAPVFRDVEPHSAGRRDSSHDNFADSNVLYSRDGTPALLSDSSSHPGAYISSSPRTPSYQIKGLSQNATKPQYQLNAPQPVMSTLSPFHADTVSKSSLTSAQGDSQVSEESLYGNTERGSQDGTTENTPDKLQPFQCEICFSQLTSRNGYTLHMQRHNKAKSKLCSFCDKTFHTSQELKSHERTHTGEKPYKCPICYYAFAHSGSFVSHKKGHTNRGETEPFLVVDGKTQYPSSFKKPRIVDPDNVKRAADGSEIEPKKKKRKKKPSTDSQELDKSGASMPGSSSSTESPMNQVARETSVIRRNSLDPAGEKQVVSHHADNVLARRLSLNDQMLTMSGQGLVSGSGQIYSQNLDEQEMGLSVASRDKDNSAYLQQSSSYALTRSNVDAEYYDSPASYTERPHQREYSSAHADTSSSSHDYYTQVKYYPRSSSSDQYSPSNQDQLRTVPVNLAMGKTPQYTSNMDSYYSSQQQYQYDVTDQSVEAEYQQEDYEALAQFKPDPAGTEIVKKLLQHYNVTPSTYQEAAPVDYSQIQSTSDYSRTDSEPVLPMYSEHDIAAPPSYSASVQQKQYYSARQRAQEYDSSLLMSSERPLTSSRESNIMLPPQPDRQYALTSSQTHLQTDVYRSENIPRYATPDTPRYATPDTPRYATPDGYQDEQYSTQITRPPSQPYSQTYDATPSRDYYSQPLPKIESLARDSINSDQSKDSMAKPQ